MWPLLPNFQQRRGVRGGEEAKRYFLAPFPWERDKKEDKEKEEDKENKQSSTHTNKKKRNFSKKKIKKASPNASH